MPAKWVRRWRYWRSQTERDRLLAEEMRAHLDLHIEELRNQGIPSDEAETLARRRFGNLTLAREEARAVWIARWAQDLHQDARYAARSVRREPGFAAIAILSAALGIGACSTIFGVANFALFRSLPIDQPERLVSISAARHNQPGTPLSYPEVQDLGARATLDGVAAVFPMVPANLGPAAEPQRQWGWLVTASYFDVLGLRPHLGRTFSAASDDQPGAPGVIVLSHNLWRNRFGGDPGAVGREVDFNGHKVTVIGVAPPGFRGHEVALTADFWIPLSMLDRIAFPKGGYQQLSKRHSRWLMTVARLRPGVSSDAARADLAVLSAQLLKQFPKENKDWTFHVERAGQLNPALRKMVMVFFTLVLAVAVGVLLIACANVANLLLARSASRRREIATRLAVGASRGRLVRQLLVESTLLALAGGAGGLVLAVWGASAISSFQLPIQLPVDLTIAIDTRVALFAAALSVVTGVAFGLVPAFHATRQDLTTALKNAPVAVAAWRRFGLRNLLVVTQVAMSMLLLIASGLFLRSLTSAESMDLGMRTRNVLFVAVDPVLNGYTPERTRVFFDTLTRRLEALPGVRSASYTNLLPLSLASARSGFSADDRRSEPDSRRINAQHAMIGPRFFETLEISWLRGRDFAAERPDGEKVVIINEALARRAFAGQDPIGRRIYEGDDAYRIVGLVATSKGRTVGEDAEPQVF
ncbi:MAG: ADOP family duplicated permease, partial [Bryobacteraceae bacterium]